MSFAPGTRMGAFEITGTLGAGGMGEVYRARDTKLDREVAIKVLPEMFAQDPPNIGGIHGLEEGPAKAGPHITALVLEQVSGSEP